MKNTVLLALVLTVAAGFSSCKKDDTAAPVSSDQGEVITTMKLIISDGIHPSDTITFSDPDGPGGNLPASDSIILDNTNTYLMEVVLLNETVSPADTISDEVEAEGTTHLFVYTVNPASGLLTTAVNDTDSNGHPLGLAVQLTTGSAGTGSLNIKLRHYNSAADKSGGTNNYETDIDLNFGVRVQ